MIIVRNFYHKRLEGITYDTVRYVVISRLILIPVSFESFTSFDGKAITP